ncbi:MAG: hypothetical protein Q9177_003337 [Variospora cf. flavescens]
MSTRKHQLSPTAIANDQQSKRARLLSNLWHSPESSSWYSKSETSQGSTFTIRAILGEKPGEYLVDWADNRFTGEAYSPDWQPKRNVSKEAIASWENRKITGNPKQPNRHRRRKRSGSLSLTIHCSVSRTSTKKRKARAAIGAVETQLHHHSIGLGRAHSSKPSSHPGVTVLVSQHSSLDRDQYILYHSSLALSAVASLPPHPNSGFGASSPRTNVPYSDDSLDQKVVPDSQPGSGQSAYAVSSSVSRQSRRYTPD